MSGGDRSRRGGRNRPVALVAGGAGDIGAGVVDALTAAGTAVAVLDLEPNPRAALTLRCDLTDPGAVAAAVAAVRAELGEPEQLVCGAGVVHRAAVAQMRPADWQRVVDASLTSAFLVTREVLPAMQRRGGGAIVMLSSGLARKGSASGAHYAAAKSGVEALVRSVALEHARDGIRCNAVAPGPIRTRMTSGNANVDEAAAVAAIPMGRLGEVADVVDPVLFLLGPGAGYVTGQVLHVNGGMFLA
ncbi:SDR family NAD(P)-dependent oxidoreductase [Blastococcus sp. SYSU D00820]